MKQYRVEVKNSHEANEAQDLFEKLGYRKGACFKDNFPKLIITDDEGESTGAQTEYRGGEPITLNQLRTMTKKEYLDENYNLVHHKTDIEVPDGAEVYAINNGFSRFFYGGIIDEEWSVLWQRTPSVDKSQWDIQVGGDHYKSMKIQPAKFALENRLDYCQANAIKYICRHESKNGKQDLEKAKHYIDLLIEHYYG